ncbi:hypothetical protein AKJ16_DCAP15739 [Drosera capensis]
MRLRTWLLATGEDYRAIILDSEIYHPNLTLNCFAETLKGTWWQCSNHKSRGYPGLLHSQ